MDQFNHSNLVNSELYQLFKKLSMQSKEAIVDEDEFDDFKLYMHIEREIEKVFEEKINKELFTQSKSLLLIVGNVGDGKSHMLSYINQKYKHKFNEKNVRIHNDATETDSPTTTSIETMIKVLDPFSDKNLDNNRTDRLIVAINLGILTNLITELEETNRFNQLIAYIKKSKVLEKRKYEEVSHKYFNMVSFNAEKRFTFIKGELESNLYGEALNRVFNKDKDNIFYQAYLKDIENNINDKLHQNYEFMLEDSIKETIKYLLIRAEIEHKEIISARDLFNFFYDICMPIDETETPFSYLPYLLFMNPARSNLLFFMNRLDPAKLQSKQINELAIELYHSLNTYDAVLNRLTDSNYLFKNIFDGILKQDQKSKQAKINFDEYLNSYLRVLFLIDYKDAIMEDHIFNKYLEFTETIKKGSSYRELMKIIQASMERWNGESLKKRHMIKDTSNNNVKLLVNIDLKYEKPMVIDNEIIIPFKVANSVYDLSIDFKVFEVLLKVKNGYFLKKGDYQQAIRFDRFVDFYLNNHILMDKNFLYNLQTEKTYVLEDDFGDVILRGEEDY